MSIALAFLGIVTAAATRAHADVLCSSESMMGSCAPNQQVTHLHEVSVGRARLLTDTFSLECEALFLGDVKPGGNSLAVIRVEGFYTYTNCTGDCVFTEENIPTEIRISGLGHETRGGLGYSLVHVDCPAFINCTYKSPGMHGSGADASLARSKTGELSFEEQPTLKESGMFCLDNGGKLDIRTAPTHPIYVIR